MRIMCAVKHHTAKENFAMDHLSAGNDEIGFDDNGVQHAFMLASWQEFASSDLISENDTEDSQLSHCVATPPGRERDESTERKSHWAVPFDDSSGTISSEVLPETVRLMSHEESTLLVPNAQKDSKRRNDQKENLDVPVGQIIKKEGAENVDRRSAVRSIELEDRKAKFRSGLSAKEGGSLKSITELEILSSVASFWATSCALLSWQFSVSLTVGILFLMPSVGVEGGLTSVPINTLIVVGKTARINCSTNLNQPVYWTRTLAQSDVQQWLYYGADGFHSSNADYRFSIHKDETTGRYDLIIADVQLKDAGQYVCIDESGLGARASVELVVSDPIECNSHIPSDGVMGYNVFGVKQDLIQISCSLTYTGNLSPTLEWSWPGSDVQNDVRDVSAAKSSVMSTLKLFPTKEHDNVTFQCKANIEGATQPTLDSGLLWESETVNVKYAEFAPEEVDACPGVEWNLVCNPQCSCSFEERKDHECRCLYTYYDARTQQDYEVASYAVRCAKDNGSLPVVLIAVAIVAAAILVATVMILFGCLKMKKTKQSPGKAESGQTSNSDDSRKSMIEEI